MHETGKRVEYAVTAFSRLDESLVAEIVLGDIDVSRLCVHWGACEDDPLMYGGCYPITPAIAAAIRWPVPIEWNFAELSYFFEASTVEGHK
jgi:hypothetical protein